VSSPDSYCGGIGYTSYSSSDCASYCVKCNCAASETSCNDGFDNDCNGLTDCQDPACAQTDFCLGQNPCDTGYQDGNYQGATSTCTQSPTACGAGASNCCYGAEHDFKPTGSVYTYCCYASRDTTQVVASDCPTTCTSKQLKTYLGETCASTGWACTYNTQVVGCCSDLDCSNANVFCAGRGNRYAKCDSTAHTCTVCDVCQINTDCSNQCCEKEPVINKDVNGNGVIGDCVGVGSTVTVGTKYYLCA